jgi:hypothetical protein
MERMDGKGKLSQADTHASLGQVLRKRGKLAEAEAQFRAAVSIENKEIGPDDLDLPRYLVDLSRVLAEQNKLVEARQQAEEAIAICKRHPAQVAPGYQDRAAAALRDVMKKLDDVAANKSE